MKATIQIGLDASLIETIGGVLNVQTTAPACLRVDGERYELLDQIAHLGVTEVDFIFTNTTMQEGSARVS